jgi:hypothetical protein
MQGGWPHFHDDLHRREASWVSHQRQLDEIFDRAVAELRPQAVVFASGLLFCRIEGQVDTVLPEIREADRDGATALTKRYVKIHAQDCDRALLRRARYVLRQCCEASLCLCRRAREKLALGSIEFEREGKVLPMFPRVFRQKSPAGNEIPKRRRVRRRRLRAPGREQVELCKLHALVA